MEKNNNDFPVIFHGYKNADLVYCDNDAYLNFMILQEWDENVWSYFQPNMHMVLKWGGNKQMYINIDFQVERSGNRVELVHLFDGEQFDENLWSRANSYAGAFNMEFIPFRVMDVSEEPRCSNLAMLWQDAKLEILGLHIDMLTKFFQEETQPNIKKLRQTLTSCGFDVRLANTFMFHKAVMADVENNPINEKTVLRPNREFNVKSRIQKLNVDLDHLFTFF